jgi:hypothetical protein
MGFITPDEIKTYPLPVNASQWAKIGDDQLQRAIDTASERISNWLDRKMAVGNYVERYNGSGTGALLLRQYPVITVNSVSSVNLAGTVRLWNINDFRVDADAGILYFANTGRWAFFRDLDWTVDYNAGFVQLPEVVKHATALQTIIILQPMFRGGREFTETKLIEGIDEQIVDMLDELKRRRMS